MTWRWW